MREYSLSKDTIYSAKHNGKTNPYNNSRANLVELAARADCGDREDEWSCDMFTAHLTNRKSLKNHLQKQVRHKMLILPR